VLACRVRKGLRRHRQSHAGSWRLRHRRARIYWSLEAALRVAVFCRQLDG
jgi:hypothetical protein